MAQEVRITKAERQHALIEAAATIGGLDAAIEVLTARKQWEKTVVALSRPYACFPWDGALALERALQDVFGFAMAQATPGFFGDTPPTRRAVPSGPDGQVTEVMWGRFGLPGSVGGEGWLQTGATLGENGMVQFALNGKYLQKYDAKVQEVARRVAELVQQNSLYKGKYVRMQFFNNDGERLELPEAAFPTLRCPSVLEFDTDLQVALEEEVFVPLRHFERLLALGAKSKRGVLLDGPPGVGKTLLMQAAAAEAVANGWTVLQVKDSQEFRVALQYVQNSPPLKKCLVQVEDIDRTASGARTLELDQLLNALDGVDTKGCHLMVMMTTNNRATINATMLRVERLDSIFRLEAPNGETAARILRRYAEGKLASDCDTTPAGGVLSGQIPAAIRDCVDRAIYAALRRSPTGEMVLTTQDLENAAKRIVQQDSLRNRGQTLTAPVRQLLLEYTPGQAEEVTPVGLGYHLEC